MSETDKEEEGQTEENTALREGEAAAPAAPGEPKIYKCKYCDFTTTEPLKLGQHTNKNHRAEIRLRREEKSKGALTTQSGMTEREEVATKGEEGLLAVKRARLERFLERAPDVSAKMADWILDQWDLNDDMKQEPNTLFATLRQNGVREGTCHTIVQALIAVERQYADLLQAKGGTYYRGARPQQAAPFTQPYGGYQPQNEGMMPAGPYPTRRDMTPQRQPAFDVGGIGYQPYPPQQQPQYPQMPPQPGVSPYGGQSPEVVTQEYMGKMLALERAETAKTIAKVLDEKSRKDKLDEVMESQGALAQNVMEQQKTITNLVEQIKKGEIGGPPPVDPLERKLSETDGKIEKLREAISQRPKEDEATKRLQADIQKLEQANESLKTAITENKTKALEDKIEDSNRQLDRIAEDMRSGKYGAHDTSGYQTDEGKIIGTGLHETAQILRDRKPVEHIVRVIAPEGGATMPGKTLQEGARGRGLLGRIRKEDVAQT